MELTYRESVVWAAAFLDGEGSFGAYPNGVGKGRTMGLVVSCGQKQKWPLQRLQSIFGCGSLRTRGQRGGMTYWGASGPNAKEVMTMIYPFMSPRRQEQIFKALSQWKVR